MKSFMAAWEKTKETDDYKKQVWGSRQNTGQRIALRQAARAARQNLVRAKKIYDDLCHEPWLWEILTATEQMLVSRFRYGRLARIREGCDAAIAASPKC